MTSQTVKQIITIHNLRNISRSKSNQPIRFGQLIKYSAKIFFFKNYAENTVGRLIPDLFLFSKITLYRVKANSQHLNFDIFW